MIPQSGPAPPGRNASTNRSNRAARDAWARLLGFLAAQTAG